MAERPIALRLVGRCREAADRLTLNSMDEEIRCECCGSRVSLTRGPTGWPTLVAAASVAAAHRDCLRKPAEAPTS